MEKLKFGDVAVKEAAARYGRERAKFERLLDRAMPAMRQRYLMLLGYSAKGIGSTPTYEQFVHDRELLRLFGSEALREAARRLKERDGQRPGAV